MNVLSLWRAAPPPVKKASGLVLSYAVLVLMGTLWFAIETDFSQLRELGRGLLRAGGMAAIALWLPTLDKRAWWFAVMVCAVLVALGLVGIATVAFAGIRGDGASAGLLLRIAVPVYLLGQAAFVLVRKPTRALFRSACALAA